MKREVEVLEAAGTEVGEYAFHHHVATRGYKDDIYARAKALGLASAITCEPNRIALNAAYARLRALLNTPQPEVKS